MSTVCDKQQIIRPWLKHVGKFLCKQAPIVSFFSGEQCVHGIYGRVKEKIVEDPGASPVPERIGVSLIRVLGDTSSCLWVALIDKCHSFFCIWGNVCHRPKLFIATIANLISSRLFMPEAPLLVWWYRHRQRSTISHAGTIQPSSGSFRRRLSLFM